MHKPRLCLTVTGQTMDELRRGRDASSDADIVELRLDSVERPDVAGALQGRRTPVIVTCRPQWEGGMFRGSEDERRRILESAIRQGAEFVDIEAAAAFACEFVRVREGQGVVLSSHAFGSAPVDLPARYASLRAMGPEVVKLAIEVDGLDEMLPLFELASTALSEFGNRHVFLAMGRPGVPSRVLAGRLGNRWTYAGNGVAPGQIPAARLLSEFRFRSLRPDADLYGVVGRPIAHSLSPAMHNSGFAALGVNAVYVPLEARDAGDFVRFAKHTGLRGASITAPFKVALMSHVDEIDPIARGVGAINTIVVRNNRWIGANTDIEGFLAPLTKRIPIKGVRASILGAGGAARAVAFALADRGAAVTICARRADAARELADRVGGSVGEFPPAPSTWDVLVNATPVGSLSDPRNPMSGAPLDGKLVFDLVYAPEETALLREARAAGCRTIGGIEMLVAQAERQFELWTGQAPPPGLFQEATRYP
jgi:3-dehydroquinate dehydratase/shikimate dehydrogenase